MIKAGFERNFILMVVAGLVILLPGCKTTVRQAKSLQQAGSSVAAADNSQLIPLIGTKWLLVELQGQAVVNNGESKELFCLQLSQDGKVSAYAGCNRMFGGYELKEGFRIHFTDMASTRMACPDMKTEQILGEALQTSDNYSLNGNKMTLNKAKMAPLAVFEAGE